MNGSNLPHVIDNQDLVGQIEDEVALILGTRQMQLHRLELEYQIVTKRAVEPEMLIFGAAEQLDQPTQNGKDRGLPAPALFGKTLVGLIDLAGDAVGTPGRDANRRQMVDALQDRLQEDPAALVQCLERKLPPPRGKHQRRIHKTHVPPRIPAGELEARGK